MTSLMFCAQIVGKPVTAPEPIAAPAPIAARCSRRRREIPLELPFVIRSAPFSSDRPSVAVHDKPATPHRVANEIPACKSCAGRAARGHAAGVGLSSHAVMKSAIDAWTLVICCELDDATAALCAMPFAHDVVRRSAMRGRPGRPANSTSPLTRSRSSPRPRTRPPSAIASSSRVSLRCRTSACVAMP